MRLALSLLFATISVAAVAQFPVSPNAFDENNLKTGHWTILYDSAGKVVTNADSVVYYRLVRFENGKPVGKVRNFYKTFNRQWDGYLSAIDPDIKYGETNYYYENGHLQFHGYYFEDKLNGPFQGYSEKGNLISEGNMKNDSSDGKWIFYYESGARSVVSIRSANLDSGSYEEYYESGTLSDIGTKSKGQRTGLWKTYHENGKLAKTRYFKDDKLDGPYVHYSEEGAIDEQGEYVNDVKSGYWTYFDDKTGTKSSAGKYVNGNREGIWEWYWPSGNVKARSLLINNIQQNDYTAWFDNGQISAQGKLKDDLSSGRWKFYYDDGTLKRDVYYDRDTLNGHCIYFYPNGKKDSEGDVVMQNKDGRWIYYDEEGSLTTVENYKNGKTEGEQVNYFSDGKVKDKSFRANGKYTGTFISFYPTGQTKVSGRYKGDEREGEWTWFHEDGSIQSRYMYHDGLYEGPWAEFFPNGKPSLVGAGKKNVNEGKITSYYANGQVKSIGKAVHGLHEGKWTDYDSASGKKIAQGKYVRGEANGVWTYFDAQGRKESIAHFIHGFKENVTNISDSIDKNIEAKQYELALRNVSWMERVLDRDYPKESGFRSRPALYRSNIYYDRKDFPAALSWAEQYEKDVLKLEGDTAFNYLVALNGIALNKIAVGRYDEAFDLFDRVLKLEGYQGEDYIITLANKAIGLAKAGRKQEAVNTLKNALEVSKQNQGDTTRRSLEIFQSLAHLEAYTLDEYSAGRNLYMDYLRTLNRASEYRDERFVEAMRSVGWTYKLEQNRHNAIEWYSRAIALEDSMGLSTSIHYQEDLSELAHLQLNVDKLDTARILFDRLTKNLEALSETQSVLYARALDGKATIAFYKDDVKPAIEGWKEAARILEDIGETSDIYYTGILQGLSIALKSSGDVSAAEAYIKKAISITLATLGEGHLQYPKLLLSQASFYRGENQFVLADSITRKAIALIAKYDGVNVEAYADAQDELGLLYYDQSRYAGAIAAFEKSMEYRRKNQVNNPWAFTNTLAKLGKALRLSGDYNNAEKIIAEEISTYEQENKKRTLEYINARTQLAHLLNDKMLYSEAEKVYLSVLKDQAELSGEQSFDYGRKLDNVGFFYMANEENKKAETYYLKYLALTQAPAYRNGWQYIEANYKLGYLYANMGQIAKADEFYKKSISLSLKFYGPKSDQYAKKLNQYGSFCQKQGRRSDAASLYTQATNIIENVFGKGSQIYFNYAIDEATADLALGKNAEAEKILAEMNDAFTKNSQDGQATYKKSLELLADFYSSMGRYDEAVDTYTDLLEQVELTQGRHVAFAEELTLAASIDYSAKNYEFAKDKIGMSLVILREELEPGNYLIMNAHNLLGLIALAEGNLDAAEENFNICLRRDELYHFTKSLGYATELHNLAVVKTEKGQFATAESLFNQADAIKKGLGIKMTLEEGASYQDNVAQLYQAWGKFPEAEKNWREVLSKLQGHIRENFPYMSDYEKTKFWQKNKEDFEDFTTFAMLARKQSPSIVGALYDVQLVTKGILLSASNKVRKRVYASQDTAQINMYYDWVQTREFLSKEYEHATSGAKTSRIDSLEKHVNAIEKELSLSAEDKHNEKQATWKDVQKTLGPDEAAVELIRFHYFDRHLTDSVIYAALVITSETKSQPIMATLPNGNSLEKRSYRYYRNAMINQLDDTVSYSRFWSFISPMLRDKKKIFLAPDGVYNQINLNTLRDHRGNFLMDTKSFVLVSSTRDLVSVKTRKKFKVLQSASLIGNPKFFLGRELNAEAGSQRDVAHEDRSGIKDLPGTKREVEAVGSLLTEGGWRVNSLVQVNASEENLKQLPSSRVVHLATHGFFNDNRNASWSSQDPMMRSGILLSGASNFLQDREEFDGENGILTAYEASNLSLEGTEMVVLSACETARGDVQQGEGVYGLQRAFISAGAETLVMSLWKIDDEATQRLMQLFYSNWMKGMDKNAALAAAEQELRKAYPHPYYWGAFVMMKG